MAERPEHKAAADNDDYVPHEVEELRDAAEHAKHEDDDSADDEQPQRRRVRNRLRNGTVSTSTPRSRIRC